MSKSKLHRRNPGKRKTSLKSLRFSKNDVIGILKESLNNMGKTFKKRKRQLGL